MIHDLDEPAERSQDHLLAAQELARAARALCDGIARLPAGGHSRDLVERLTALTTDVERHVRPSNVPWYYEDPRTARRRGGPAREAERERDELSDFNPMMPPLKVDVEGTQLSGTVIAGPAFTGPPELVHGGTQAKILDHMCGLLVAEAGPLAVTARLEVDFRRGAPVESVLELSARIDSVSERKVWVEGEISFRGEVCSRARVLFVVVDHPPPGDRR